MPGRASASPRPLRIPGPPLGPSLALGVGISCTATELRGGVFLAAWDGPPVFAPSCRVGVGSIASG